MIGPTIPKKYFDRIVGGKVVIKQLANVATNSVIFTEVKIVEGAVNRANTIMHIDSESWTIYIANPVRKFKL